MPSAAAPLGLFSFALTTFVISCYNASATAKTNNTHAVVVPLGLFYGGAAQVLAGMWAFMGGGDAFAATAFTSYGAFWLSYAALLVPGFGVQQAYEASNPAHLRHDMALFLLAWTLFTCLMLVASTRTSTALCALFAMVASTFLLLTAAEFVASTSLRRAAGVLGILTAALAWYNALAELLHTQEDPIFSLPLGKHRPSANANNTSPAAAATDSAQHRRPSPTTAVSSKLQQGGNSV